MSYDSFADETKRAALEASEIDFLNKCRRFERLAVLVLPFGKYVGEKLGDIPMSYLDQTVSTMPPTWIVRRVQEFVDFAMFRSLMNEMPSISWNELLRRAGETDANRVNES